MTKLHVGPRDGEFGKSWTRAIGRGLYWFRLTPDGKRLMIQRESLTQRYTTTIRCLYAPGVDPEQYEAELRAPWVELSAAQEVLIPLRTRRYRELMLAAREQLEAEGAPVEYRTVTIRAAELAARPT